MFLKHIDREDHDLFFMVADSDPEDPTEEEAAAFDELVNRGYSASFLLYELHHHWETRGVAL